MAMNSHDSDDPEIRLTALEDYLPLLGAEAVACIQTKADRRTQILVHQCPRCTIIHDWRPPFAEVS